MVAEIIMAKVADAAQATQLPALAGKSFTVGKVSVAGNGIGNWLFLVPQGSAGVAGKGALAVKLESSRQMAQLSAMVGKPVTIGKAPAAIGAASKWLVLHPGTGVAAKSLATAAVGTGAAGAGVAAKGMGGSQLVMLKLEGARQAAQVSALSGKSFTVAKASATGNGASNWLFLKPAGGAGQKLVALKVQNGATQLPALVGKTFTIGKCPMVAGNAAKWMVMQPTSGIAAKSVAGTALAAKGSANIPCITGLGSTGKTAVLNGAGKAALGGKAATMTAVSTKAAAASGTIWSGTGLSLGLGLGLGAMGPVLAGGLAAAVGYGVYRARKGRMEREVVFEPEAEATA
ncbi:MAG: hypothetical protein HQ514_21080 [Rhodospirillales bacterium]|nr:hypothetical protein [Rhodospirillales bacterium]